MKVHEYQAKQLLKTYGVPVSDGYVVEQIEQAEEVIRRVQADYGSEAVVVKAQIHAGGRGKGGGVKYSPDFNTALANTRQILGMNLITKQTGSAGQLVRKVLISPAVKIEKEFYLAITLDRGRARNVIIASAEGGVEIEEVAEKNPEKICKQWVDPAYGLLDYQAQAAARALGLEGKALRQGTKFVTTLYEAYVGLDASLVEINPLVLTDTGQLLALDGKVTIDDNALYRHPEVAEMRDIHEEDPNEVEASKQGLNYIKLDGNVGCMVNGAGLAMATMDIIKLKGGEPANFLDIGGGANRETIKRGFEIILGDENVKAVLVNIFGGIVRCDLVANSVVAAARELGLQSPVVVRLDGTNAEEGKRILAESGVAIVPVTSLNEAATKVVELATA